MQFSELIKERYLDVGMSKEQVLSKVYVESGVSRGSIRKALGGTRISPENASELAEWARRLHKVDLDEKALVSAPTVPTKSRKVVADAER